MKKLLTIALILCTLTASAQMRGGSQFDPGAARANLTNITSGSALGVDHGGTGATTAAAGLAALGGASLNGSSTVDFSVEDFYGTGKIVRYVELPVGSTPLTTLLRVSILNPYGKITIVNTNGTAGYADFAMAGTVVTMIVDGGNFGVATSAAAINLYHDGNSVVIQTGSTGHAVLLESSMVYIK